MIITDLEQLSERVKKYVPTKQELAAEIGIKPQQLSRLINKKKNVGRGTILKVNKWLEQKEVAG